LKRCTYLHESKGEGVGGGVVMGDPEDGPSSPARCRRLEAAAVGETEEAVAAAAGEEAW
jgi:hypothetical protein